jgi:phenylalanyl-tRNA synthetase beta chain
MLRPSMMETGLESILNNLNRKNNQLQLFEFGKTYHSAGVGNYSEKRMLTLFVTGEATNAHWRSTGAPKDLFYLKAAVANLLSIIGLQSVQLIPYSSDELNGLEVLLNGKQSIGVVGFIGNAKLRRFDIKQPVLMANLNWDTILTAALQQKVSYKELAKYPAVERDLALVLDKAVSFAQIEAAVQQVKLPRLQSMRLFDVFESDKLGAGKKSLAIKFVFQDAEKTLTDSDVESMVGKLMKTFEKELQAEIRK